MRIIFFVVSLLAAAFLPGLALAQSAIDQPLNAKAPYALLIDEKSGKILFERDADVPISPASMSKLMVHAIVFDMLKSGQLAEDTKFQASRDLPKRVAALGPKAAQMNIRAREQVSVLDLLKGSIILSANDANILLAEGIDQRQAVFVSRMNSKAEELGLKTARFANVTGFDDPDEKISVRDLAKLAEYIINEHPEYFPLYAQREFTWNKLKQFNRNPLLSDYRGADGLKTGQTAESGYSLVGTAQREGRRLVLVIAGLPTEADRKAEAAKMLDWGLSRYRTVQVYQTGDKVGEARVWGGNRDFVDLVTRDSFQVTLTPEERATAEVKLTYQGPLLAPVTAGTVVGKVRVTVEGKTIAELPVMTSTSVEPVNSMWEKAWDSAKIMIFGG
ncbi:MAG: D-alanyl-D-alanine carboxypeptidase [Proteobacteria bacterium]|nr:D-alanyl-D-alanine carboxypeptidase [Pseudomonadota bacterium]